MCLCRLFDEVAERYLDLVDNFDGEVEELEDMIREWPSARIRSRISEIRHDMLHIRRVLGPTRDTARSILDNRLELDGDVQMFPREVEIHFADTYDKLSEFGFRDGYAWSWGVILLTTVAQLVWYRRKHWI